MGSWIRRRKEEVNKRKNKKRWWWLGDETKAFLLCTLVTLRLISDKRREKMIG